MLHEVELLVGGSDDEVLPLDLAVLARLPPVGADHGDRGLPAERRIGQNHGPSLARVGDERVLDVDQARPVRQADAVQQQVHRGQPGCSVDELVPADQPVAQVRALVRCEVFGVARGMLVCDQ